MSKALQNHKRLLCLICGLVLLAFALMPGAFIQAQSKKEEKQITLQDAVERLGPNKIRARPGFKLIEEEGGWAVEQVGKTPRRLEKRVKCGTCPGGNCKPRNGTCVPRNSCTSTTCLVDPF